MKASLKYLMCLAILIGCKKGETLENTDCSKINASYSNDIKPIIQVYCQNYGCHKSGDTNGDYTTYEGLKAKADNGTLNERVLRKKDMPRPDLRQMTLDDLRKIKCWLDNGAPNN
jgi:hypothetical protein